MAWNRTRLNRGMMWGAGAMAAVVAGLALYAVVSGGDDGPTEPTGQGRTSASAPPASPAPTYAPPDDWTEPARWAALVHGSRAENHRATGFPQTTTGALSMLAAANETTVEGATSTVDEQLGIYTTYVADADKSAANEQKVKQKATQADASIRRQLGLPANGPLPSGAYARNHVVGFKVIKEDRGEVSAWLLTRVTMKAGETDKERGSYTRTLAAAAWQNGDWKISSAAVLRAARQAASAPRPAMAAPGDAAFNRAGWTAIREAS
ncbi:hypothetical protein ACH4FX_37340 [Streptomyces sp. NPDC018019]|uniref:hypothetical protein n=1 Tax=Streptomyces sp. NPDC018019 TaxID=3365030 RepID=UPI003796923F